jgi:protein SCO1/2
MFIRRDLFTLRRGAGVRPARAEDAAARAATKLRGPRSRYFPNYPLLTHEGKRVRFYDDLVHRRLVVFNMMYADCSGVCPTITSNLVKVQKALGDRVGRDIFMYSITLQPEKDSADVLRTYAAHHGVGPGWLLLTGRPAEIDVIRRRLGFFDSDPKVDRDPSNHSAILRFGNEAIDSWGTCSARARPQQIVDAILWMDVEAATGA